MNMFKTIRRHLRARNIRSIRIIKWTEQFIPVIQEEMYPLSDPDTIEQLAYLRAVSLVDLLSDLAKIRKSELILIRMLSVPNLPQEVIDGTRKIIEQMKRERLERLFTCPLI